MNEKNREAARPVVGGQGEPKVMAALLDLARLSQQVVSTAPGAIDLMATLLLEHVFMLCEAQRGALVLTMPSPLVQDPSFVSPLLNGQKVHLLARLAMSEEEALTRLATFSLAGKDIQRSPVVGGHCSRARGTLSGGQVTRGEPNDSAWITCRLPLAFPPVVGGQGEPTSQQDESDESADSERITQPIPFMQAFLLVGWATTGKESEPALQLSENETRISMAEKGRLPFILDAVSAVIVNMLLVERLHELETITNRKALQSMELLKAELLATVSHELRSPLASIKGYAATLLRHEHRIARDERHEFLVAINEASDRLATLIDRLLEMSQLDTDAITIERSPVNLARLIGEAIYAAEQRLLAIQTDTLHVVGGQGEPTQKHCTFNLRLEDAYGRVTSEEPVIQADHRRLREVLDNLLENAITYSPEDGVVEVVIRPVVASLQAGREHTLSGGYHASDPGRTGLSSMQVRKAATQARFPGKQEVIEICVRDSGKGIPAEQLESIFERFHRVDTRLTREVGGLGLGLTICKRIVELHQGAIWAESVVGQGSTFHVWLPKDRKAVTQDVLDKSALSVPQTGSYSFPL